MARTSGRAEPAPAAAYPAELSSFAKRHKHHLRLIDRSSIEAIDDDDEVDRAGKGEDLILTRPTSSSSSSAERDRSRAPAMPARQAILVRWLENQEVAGAAGLVHRFGVRRVLDVLNDMLEPDQKAWFYERRHIWRISGRFKNPGGFLNWSLSRGGYRRPTWNRGTR